MGWGGGGRGADGGAGGVGGGGGGGVCGMREGGGAKKAEKVSIALLRFGTSHCLVHCFELHILFELSLTERRSSPLFGGSPRVNSCPFVAHKFNVPSQICIGARAFGRRSRHAEDPTLTRSKMLPPHFISSAMQYRSLSSICPSRVYIRLNLT